MRNVSILFSIFLISAAGFAQKPAPTADDVARRAVDILGGGGAIQHARYFSYTFNLIADGKLVASFPQRWDRFTGEYRVSGVRPDGLPFDVSINVATKRGHGSIQGRKVTDNTEFQQLYNLAFQRFVNDTFWLLMPMRLMDPDAHRSYEGERTDSCGRTWDLLKVSFDQGGLNPSDVYWPWINRDTGVVEEWDMKVAAMKADDRPLQVLFHDYRRVAGLLISTVREVRGKNQVVRLDDLQILAEPPKGAFGE
jgi:hypothetical protein